MAKYKELINVSANGYVSNRWNPSEGHVSWLYFNSGETSEYRQPVLVIPCTRGADVYGQTSFVELSNYQYLVETHGDLVARLKFQNVDELIVFLDMELPDETEDEDAHYKALALVDDINNLLDYPLLDEDRWAAMERDEWLDSWADGGYNRSDLERELGRSLTADEEERLFDLFEQLGVYPEEEYSATYPSVGIEVIAAELKASC